jgi:hypothetical protein
MGCVGEDPWAEVRGGPTRESVGVLSKLVSSVQVYESREVLTSASEANQRLRVSRLQLPTGRIHWETSEILIFLSLRPYFTRCSLSYTPYVMSLTDVFLCISDIYRFLCSRGDWDQQSTNHRLCWLPVQTWLLVLRSLISRHPRILSSTSSTSTARPT